MLKVVKWKLHSYPLVQNKEEEVGKFKARLENQAERLINEAIFLTSRNESYVKLTRIEEPNNLHIAQKRRTLTKNVDNSLHFLI